MKTIKEIAYEMYSESQAMLTRTQNPHSFYEGYRGILFNGKVLKYQALTMCFIDNSALHFSTTEWKELGQELYSLLSSKDNAWLKSRNEYRILFEYMICHHLDDTTLICKRETPDFVLQMGNKRSGIEITELTPSEMKRLDKVTDVVRFEGRSSAKLKTFKETDYDIIPAETPGVFCCKRRNPNVNLEKDVTANIDLIKKKLCQYAVLPESLDKVHIVCDATRSIHITAPHECEWLFERLREVQEPVPNVDVVVLFGNSEANEIQSKTWSDYLKK